MIGDFDDIFPNDQSITMGLWGFMFFMFHFLGPQDFDGGSPWETLEMVNSMGSSIEKKTIHWFQGINMIQGDLPL